MLPSPSFSAAFIRRFLALTGSFMPLNISLSEWTFTSSSAVVGGSFNGGFHPSDENKISLPIFFLTGVVKSSVVSLEDTTTSPSLVSWRFKPLQCPTVKTALGLN